MKNILAVYGVISGIFALGVCAALYLGHDLSTALPGVPHASAAADPDVGSALRQNLSDPLAHLLVQLIVIVAATRLAGGLFAQWGQPAVIGEMAAGILLGPSLLGWLSPPLFAFIFPKESLGVLQLFSQIGVCVFMFVVGLELNLAHLRQRAQTALVVSHSSIMVPFLLGVLASLLLYKSFAAPGTPFMTFALFLGIAMSITAFPVLVRILSDRGMTHTPLGATATTCAAVDDATAWAVLAVIVAIGRQTGWIAPAVNLGLLLVFVAVMLTVVRPLLRRFLTVSRLHGRHSLGTIAGVLVFMTTAALTTQAIGVHALFGAFMAGVAMPRNKEIHEYLAVRLENFSMVFLLPLFFAFSGLRTQVDLLNDPASWLVVAGVVAVAVIGKLVGSMVPARLTGMPWSESFSLGVLMNTRGLVELIALNIGYDLGILPARIFSIMVLMALITTFMAGPLLSVVERIQRRSEKVQCQVSRA